MQPKIIPEPKHLQLAEGSFKFKPDTVIMLSAKGQADEYALAKQLRGKLAKFTNIEVIIEKHFSPYEVENKVFLLIPDRDREIFSPQMLAYPEDISELGGQGYFLKVSTENMVVASPGSDGLFYGVHPPTGGVMFTCAAPAWKFLFIMTSSPIPDLVLSRLMSLCNTSADKLYSYGIILFHLFHLFHTISRYEICNLRFGEVYF